MKIKKVLAVLAISALALSSMSCRATERYRRAQELRELSKPLRCTKEFGRYQFPAGWVEAGANEPDYYYYYPREYADSDTVPYYVVVCHSENEYSEEDNHYFCNDEYQNLVETYGEDAVDITGNGQCDQGQFAMFEITTDEAHIYQWYILGDYEQVLFELTVEDDTTFDPDTTYYEVESVTDYFRWN